MGNHDAKLFFFKSFLINFDIEPGMAAVKYADLQNNRYVETEHKTS